MYYALGILVGVIALCLLVPSWRVAARFFWAVVSVTLMTYCFIRGVWPDLVPGGRYDTIFNQLVYVAFSVFWAICSGLLIYDFILWRREVYAKKPSR